MKVTLLGHACVLVEQRSRVLDRAGHGSSPLRYRRGADPGTGPMNAGTVPPLRANVDEGSGTRIASSVPGKHEERS